MGLLQEKDRQFIRDDFTKNLKKPVTLVVFSQHIGCQYCPETREICEELASLSDLVSVEAYDLAADNEMAKQFSVDKVPAIIPVQDGKTFGVRFFGIPSGYEFMSLLEAIRMVSSGQVELQQETRSFLDSLTKPVHLQVFITPTCPYCPRSVMLAHKLAFYSPWVTGDMIEATEFPALSNRYSVMAVPRTVINEVEAVEGAMPEQMILPHLMEAVAKSS